MTTAGLRLGRPGIYHVGARDPEAFPEVRLDVAGFVGVALRGPVDTPTPVISWADYQRRFGGTEPNASGRDRLLPFAVQAFFAQGGSRAWIVRVTAADAAGVPGVEQATARFRLGRSAGTGQLAAADEGAWASSLEVGLRFTIEVTMTAAVRAPDRLLLPAGGEVPQGSLLRIRRGRRAGVLRWARVLPDPAFARRLIALGEPLPGGPAEPGSVLVEVVTGTLGVTDPAEPGRGEQIAGLGLHPDHPRFPPLVLPRESVLLRAHGDWDAPLEPTALLAGWTAELVHPGLDRSDRVSRASFFDDGAADDDPLDERVHRGVDAIARVPEIGLLCVPDLTWRSLPVPASPDRPAPIVRSRLDGTDDDDLDQIVERQQRVVAVADVRRRFVALIDVPPGLPTARITDWRAAFDSSYAAAYHPWLGVPRPGRRGVRDAAVLVPPSAFAAGITAERERRLGLARGPANQLALGAVLAADPVSDALADQLHQLSINVFATERDGQRLIGARTLAADLDYRQLSVRRLMTMLALTVQRHGQWLVFEPNTDELRVRLANTVTLLLRRLHRDGAFSGATEAESFFVRCDAGVNPPASLALGRLVAEIGVAPAAPLEYLVLRIASDGEGGLLVDERRRTGPLLTTIGGGGPSGG